MTAAVFPRAKLIAVLGLLASSHDGEILAAASAACRLMKAAGVSWDDVMTPAEVPAPRSRDWRALVLQCWAGRDCLTAWERAFLAEIAGYQHTPSAKQVRILSRLAEKTRSA